MDAKDRTLLPDATVFIRENVSKRTITDEKGKFRLVYPPDDRAMLEIELPGYLPYTCKATINLIILLEPDPKAPEKVREAKSRHLAKQDEKTARTTVKGVVKDANGAPIVGAIVHVQGTKLNHLLEIKEAGDYPETLGLYLTDRNAVLTDQEGKFTVRVTPGTLLVTECMGYSSCTREAAPDMVIELQDDHYDDKGIVIVR